MIFTLSGATRGHFGSLGHEAPPWRRLSPSSHKFDEVFIPSGLSAEGAIDDA